jgi:hypothetical protein
MQRLKIDVSKIEKSYLFKGKSGTYLDATLMDNREGPDQYGNDGFIVQDVGKENREKGIKGPIIGNWKHVGGKQQPSPQQRQKPASATQADDDDDSIPF